MKKIIFSEKVIPLLLGFSLTIFSLWLQLTENNTVRAVMTRLEFMAYDQRLRSTLALKKIKESPIAIVDIDGKSLQALGRWPWPRALVAQIVEELFNAGAIVIGFDVLFTEPQSNIAREILNHELLNSSKVLTKKQYEQLLSEYDHDKILANSFENGEVILGYLLHNERTRQQGQLPKYIMKLDDKLKDRLTVQTVNSYTGNIDVIQESSVDAGFTTSIRDIDGVVRRSPLILRYDDKIYPSLALSIAKSFLLSDRVSLEIHNLGEVDVVESVSLDSIRIPTDAQGKVLVPFHGRRGFFPYISAIDVIERKLKPEDIEGKIILIGTSALGLADLHSTAVQSVFPGVEVHANILAGILDKKFPLKPAWAKGVNFLSLLCMGIMMSFVFVFIGPAMITALGILTIFLQITFNFWLWTNYGFVLDIFLPIFLMIMLIIANLAYGFLFENKRKREITSMFGQYVSADLVEEMSQNPSNYNFEGKSQEMTVLFADIRNFTSISEQLSAKELKDLLNRYFEPMTEIIFNTNGTVDKYVGDMIMAFWGAPKADDMQAQHAVEAAFCMQEKTKDLQQEFKEIGLPEINIGIGLNTGIMNIGDMGSKYRRAYTVLGDNVNLASRLEASTKFYGAKILMGQKTFINSTGIVCRRVDILRVKGKEQAVAVYEPLCRESDVTQELIDEINFYEEGIFCYNSRDFVEAKTIFTELLQDHPDSRLYQIYLERTNDFLTNPPPHDWDGSYTRTEK